MGTSHLKPKAYSFFFISMDKLINFSLKKLKSCNGKINRAEIRKNLKLWVLEADKDYLRKKTGTLISQEVYRWFYVQEKILRIVSENLIGKGINMNKPAKEFKELVDFNKKYFNDGELITVSKIENLDKDFLRFIKGRNFLAKLRGCRDQIDLMKKKLEIPEDDYENFIKNIVKIRKKFKSKLFLGCEVCLGDKKIFPNVKEVVRLFKKKYPLFKKNIRKIKIIALDYSQTEYETTRDVFMVRYNDSLGENHSILELIHELSHVVNYLLFFQKNEYPMFKGKYYEEKEAIEIEKEFLSKHYPQLWKLKLWSLRKMFLETELELKLYNPKNRKFGSVWYGFLCKKYGMPIVKKTDYLKNRILIKRILDNFIYAIIYSKELLKNDL